MGNLVMFGLVLNFLKIKKIKSVPYGKSLVLHTKALENLSDKMEPDLACEVKDEVHAKNLKAMLRAVFQEDCFELGEKKIFKLYGGYWQLKIKMRIIC